MRTGNLYNPYGGDWSRGGVKIGDFARPAEAFLFGDSTALVYHDQFAVRVQYLEIRNAAEWPGFTWFER